MHETFTFYKIQILKINEMYIFIKNVENNFRAKCDLVGFKSTAEKKGCCWCEPAENI